MAASVAGVEFQRFFKIKKPERKSFRLIFHVILVLLTNNAS